MKLKMHERSLFAILLRSPAWISFALAAGSFAAMRFVLPELYAAFVGLPFFVVGCVAAWRQIRAPSAEAVEKRLAALRGETWESFSAQVEAAFSGQGYAVERLKEDGADFAVSKAGRTSVVGCRRWKVARAGAEPLRALVQVRRARDAHEALYIVAGEVSENATAYARDHNVRLVGGAQLVEFLSGRPLHA